MPAGIVAAKGIKSVSFSWKSGPNTPTVTVSPLSYLYQGYAGTITATLTGEIAGTYVYTVTATDSAGEPMSAIDSAIVLAPPPIVITGVQIPFFGAMFTVPTGQGTKISINGVLYPW
jgi:hypothetical protein